MQKKELRTVGKIIARHKSSFVMIFLFLLKLDLFCVF